MKNASYYVYNDSNPNDLTDGIKSTTNLVSFFNAQGDLVGTSTNVSGDPRLQLDPDAPKPKPVKCKLFYWKAQPSIFSGYTKGAPGWVVAFFDKHGNKITAERYYVAEKQIWKTSTERLAFDLDHPTVIDSGFPLDLSDNIQVERADPDDETEFRNNQNIQGRDVFNLMKWLLSK